MIRWSGDRISSIWNWGRRQGGSRWRLLLVLGSSRFSTNIWLLLFYWLSLMRLMLQVLLAIWQEESSDNGNNLINRQYYTLGWDDLGCYIRHTMHTMTFKSLKHKWFWKTFITENWWLRSYLRLTSVKRFIRPATRHTGFNIYLIIFHQ